MNFIQISTQRSGTTFLSTLLESHPNIYMSRELFKIDANTLNIDDDNYRYFKNTLNVEEFLNQYYKKYKEKYKSVGFTIMLNHLKQYPEIISYINKYDIKCIYMERKNHLKIAVSRLKARKTGIYHTNEKVSTKLIKIDIKDLMDELNVIDDSINELRFIAHQLKALNVFYEELILNQEIILSDIQNYLDVSVLSKLKTPLKKTSKNNLKFVIENYNEVYQKLKNTKYKRLI